MEIKIFCLAGQGLPTEIEINLNNPAWRKKKLQLWNKSGRHQQELFHCLPLYTCAHIQVKCMHSHTLSIFLKAAIWMLVVFFKQHAEMDSYRVTASTSPTCWSQLWVIMQQKKPHKMSVLFCSLGQTVNRLAEHDWFYLTIFTQLSTVLLSADITILGGCV